MVSVRFHCDYDGVFLRLETIASSSLDIFFTSSLLLRVTPDLPEVQQNYVEKKL